MSVFCFFSNNTIYKKYILVGFFLLGLFGVAQNLQQKEEKQKIDFLVKLMYDDLLKEDSFSQSAFAFRIKSHQFNNFNDSDNLNYLKEKLSILFPLFIEEKSDFKSKPVKVFPDSIIIQREKNQLKIKKNLTPRGVKSKITDVFAQVSSAGATHLIEVYFDFYDEKFRLDVHIYEVKTRLLVWSRSWKTKSSSHLNYLGLKTYLEEVDKYSDNIKVTHALSVGIGLDLVRYANLLFLIDPNFTYQKHGMESPLDLAAGLNLGFQVGLDLFSLADYWNNEINLYFVVRSMLGFRYFIQKIDKESESFQLNVDLDLGVMFALKESSFYFEIGINPLDVSPYFILGSKY